jgi:Ser/Thr protein kinase RdoA (MazF antagonist)
MIPVKDKNKTSSVDFFVVEKLTATETVAFLYMHVFRQAPAEIEPIVGKGVTNKIFLVTSRQGDHVIIRMNENPNWLTSYIKGAAAMKAAQSVGVPVPEVLLSGNTIIPHAYQISRYVPGILGMEHEGDKRDIWKQMGRLAAQLNQVTSDHYGSPLPWTEKAYSKNWHRYISFEIEHCVGDVERLVPAMFEASALKDIKRRFDELKKWRFSPALNHGDLILKNVILDEGGKIVSVIDWDDAIYHRAPAYEIMSITRDNLPEDIEYFLEGYGISEKEYKAIQPQINVLLALKLMQYLPSICRQGNTDLANAVRDRIIYSLGM